MKTPSINRQLLVTQALVVFTAMCLLDFIFALYVLEIAAKRSVQAGVLAGILQALNIFVITSYTRDPMMAAPAVLGAFVGTWGVLEFIT